jgi:hypothetical protein
LWCLRSVPEHGAMWRLYAVWCARQGQHLLTDARILAAIDIAEAHAVGLATDEELSAARTDALAARDAAWVESDAAWAASAAGAASAAARAELAARDASAAARAAASDAARAARSALAVGAAWWDESADAWAARDAAKKAQEQHLREILESSLSNTVRN